MKKYVAELIGTMILVLMGCGSAVFAGGAADTVGAGVGTIGVALAFGLSVVAMAYTIGNISGCHINPAVTLGVWLSGGMKLHRHKERSRQSGRTGNRPHFGTYPHRVHPYHGHFRQPGAEHRPGADGRRTGYGAVVAVYRGSAAGRCAERRNMEIPQDRQLT